MIVHFESSRFLLLLLLLLDDFLLPPRPLPRPDPPRPRPPRPPLLLLRLLFLFLFPPVEPFVLLLDSDMVVIFFSLSRLFELQFYSNYYYGAVLDESLFA